MKLNRLMAVAAVSAVGALTLAACGGSEAPAPVTSPTVTAPEVSVEPSVTPDAEPEAPAAVEGDLTAPGTELAIGETALVNYDHYEHGLVDLQVTVTGVREASQSDFEGVGFSEDTLEQLKSYSVYYIDATIVKNDLSAPEIAFDSAASSVSAVDADGRELPSFTIIGAFDLCDSRSFRAGIDAGEPHVTCSVMLVPEGSTFGGGAWVSRETPYARFDGSPVVWK